VVAAQTHEEAAERLRAIAATGDLILIKGSRTSRMERVLEQFRSQPSASSHPL
jgi:UDP-N-acetylmuramyl pentapeptide synthase